MRIASNGNGYNDYTQTNEFLKGVSSGVTEATEETKQTTKKTSKENKTKPQTKSEEYTAYNEIFRKIISASQKLRASFGELSSTEADSLFAKAKESGDTKELVAQVKTFLEQYNTMVKGTNEMGGDANKAFQQDLEEYFAENKENFGKLGMTLEEDGTITVDDAVLEKAGVEELQTVFGEASSFAAKVSIKSIYVEANAFVSQRESEYSSASDNYNDYITQRAKDAPHRNYLR